MYNFKILEKADFITINFKPADSQYFELKYKSSVTIGYLGKLYTLKYFQQIVNYLLFEQ